MSIGFIHKALNYSPMKESRVPWRNANSRTGPKKVQISGENKEVLKKRLEYVNRKLELIWRDY
jgi:hypothetical protein